MVASEYRPDCGYAWVVVAACFTINFIMAGLARAAGVLYIALIDVYGVSRETATAPFSLRFCLRNLSGPVVGALGQQFGIRPIVFLGGLICGLGGILSALAPNVIWITAAWGGLHGIGYGMCNLIHVIVVNRYFNKYKGLALGISLSGDCFGTFLLPPVLEFLLTTYDLRGTFLIMAGVSLNVVPAAMLLKSPPWEKSLSRSKPPSHKETASNSGNKIDCDKGEDNKGFDMLEETSRMNNMRNQTIPTITIEQPNYVEISLRNQQNMKDVYKEPGMVASNSAKTNVQHIDIAYDINRNNFINDIFINVYNLRESASLRITDSKTKKKGLRFNACPFNSENRRTSTTSILSCPSYIEKFNFDSLRKNSVNSRKSCAEVNTDIHSDSYGKQNACFQKGNDLEAVKESQLSLPVVPSMKEKTQNELDLHERNIPVENRGTNDDSVNKSFRNALRNFIKTNTKPIFLVICASMAAYAFLFISLFTIIVDYAQDNGIPIEYGKYLIIAFSVTDVFGRIGLGLVLDKKWLSLWHYVLLTVGLMGFFTAIIPFYKSLVFWIISLSLCGFVQGGVAIVFPVLVEYYVEKKEETVALGCLNFYGGVLMFPIPPMIGYFRDNIGSYDGVFWTIGASCIFAASLWILEPCLFHKEKVQTENSRNTDEEKNNHR